MSLRARLAIGLALLVAVAATAAMGIAYAATAGRLEAQLDASLRQGAARLATMPIGRGPFAGPGGGSRAAFNAGPGPLGALGLVVVQYLDAGGDVVSREGEVTLPVLAHDRALASSGGSAWLHSVSVRAGTYRVLTQPLPGGGAVQLARDDSENQSLLGSLRWRFGLLDLAVVIVAAGAGWLFSRRLTRPLRRLAGAAEQVASTGRLDVPIDSAADDETGRLALAFATMLEALSRARATQHQLAEDAAHELRTPLTSLRTNVDILRRHDDLALETRTRILGALDTELRELTGLLDELVELSTERRDEEEAEPLRLDELVAAVVERARQRTGRTIDLGTEECLVQGRPRALARAVANLVDNAVKFSSEPAPVEVRVRAGRVEVRDHGPGIAPEDLPRVFDRFYRSAAARAEAGSGLGLAIVAHVAETHGGRVFALSHPEGGSVVGFELATTPATPAPAAASRAARRPTTDDAASEA